MAERIQFPALNDLETVVRSLSRTSKGPVAAIFDPKHGWCVTDEIRVVESKHGSLEVAFTCQSYKDWFRESISEACAQLFAVRFVPGTLLGKLFKPDASTGDTGQAPQPEVKAEQKDGAVVAKRTGPELKHGQSGQQGTQASHPAVTSAAAQRGGKPAQQQTQPTPQGDKGRPSVGGQGGPGKAQVPVQSTRVPSSTSALPRRSVKHAPQATAPKAVPRPGPAPYAGPVREKPPKRSRSEDDQFPELPV